MNECYKCKYRGTVMGSVHSKCQHPKLGGKTNEKYAIEALLGGPVHWLAVLGVVGDSHGIENGWFNWPLDFDPVWLKSCNGFEE